METPGPPPRRPRAVLRLVLVVVGIALALFVARILVPIGLAWRHYSTTPDFATYVREHPVAAPLPAELWPPAEVLAEGASWSTGEVDPFALAEDDPELEPWRATWRATLQHGDDLLLDLVQEVAIAAERENGDRRGVAVRTTRCTTAAGMRAHVRLWVSDPAELLGPGSVLHGRVDFDVALVAGGGEDRLEVVLRPPRGAPEIEPTDPLGTWSWGLLGLLHPTDGLPGEGLVHRVQQGVFLTWMRHENGSQNLSWGEARHQVNTSQYSYACVVSLESGGTTSTARSTRTYTWNGELW